MTTQDKDVAAVGKVFGIAGVARLSNEPQCINPNLTPHSTLRQHSKTEESVTDEISSEENMKLRMSWNSTMCKVMQIPEGYQDIAVLMIKWTEKLDEFKAKTKFEVEKLKGLFENSFKYETKVVELDNSKSNPQFQLGTAITSVLETIDGPHNLLIVYYTGHGSWNIDEEYLELHAYCALKNYDEVERLTRNARSNKSEALRSDEDFPASAIWNEAEGHLIRHARCDVLAILDTCYASNLSKNFQKDDGRAYEVLAASGLDKPTARPGPRSFTTALIASLEALLEKHKEKPFTTRELCDEINQRRRGFKVNNQSHVHDRLKRYKRHINLTPLKNNRADRVKEFRQDPTRGFLTLDLPLTVDCLTNEQAKALATTLSKAVKDYPVKRINFVKFESLKKETITFPDLLNDALRQWTCRWLEKKYGRIWKKRCLQSPKHQSQVTQTTPTLERTRNGPPDNLPSSQLPAAATTLVGKPPKRKRSQTYEDAYDTDLRRNSPERHEFHEGPITPISGIDAQDGE